MERPRDDARILLVDDEQEWLDILSLAFADEHWIVDAVSSGREALARLRENRYDLVLCDMSMPGMTGIELLRHLQAGGDDTPFIIMTGVGTIRTAVEAMQFGAYNYITKPFRSDDLTALARQALEHGRMHRSLRRAENSGEEKEAPGSVFPFVLGASSALRNILTTLRRVAVSSAPVLIEGETGTGKSMLARRLPSILPDLTRREALEATEIHSVLGLTTSEHPLLVRRPFRSPHHTVSAMGMAGGGSSPRPGEISLAHNGVLFLDELPEFSKEALETLRQPLEDGRVQISRVSGTAVFPARFMLVCAMNPCKCGWYGYSDRCRCSPQAVEKYLSRLSGPLLDRIDLFVEVPPLDFDALSRRTPAEPSAAIKARVDGARAVQAARFGPGGPACNDQMGPAELSRFCALDDACRAVMKGAFDRMGLTARSYDRILRVARTIADLDGAGAVAVEHLAEALQYRPPEYLRR